MDQHHIRLQLVLEEGVVTLVLVTMELLVVFLILHILPIRSEGGGAGKMQPNNGHSGGSGGGGSGATSGSATGGPGNRVANTLEPLHQIKDMLVVVDLDFLQITLELEVVEEVPVVLEKMEAANTSVGGGGYGGSGKASVITSGPGSPVTRAGGGAAGNCPDSDHNRCGGAAGGGTGGDGGSPASKRWWKMEQSGELDLVVVEEEEPHLMLQTQ